MQNFLQQLQTLWSEKRKTFSGFFIAFLKCAWNLQHLEKKDECPCLTISEIIFSEDIFTETSRRSCFRTPFGNQRFNGFQTPLKVARHHCYTFSPWISGKLSLKKTALLWSKILRLFANTLTADDKYSCRNMQNFPHNFKRLYLKNGRLFLDFLLHFWNVDKI